MTKIILPAALLVSACAYPSAVIDRQREACTQIGYIVDSPEFLACVERGANTASAAQNAAVAASTSTILSLAIADLLY